MLFNSLEFLIFFPIVVAIYYLLEHKYRWIFLLICSYYFYICWKEEYIFLIAASTLIDYYCGLKMGSLKTKIERKPYLIASLITNLTLLFSFKYFNFVSDSLNVFFGTGYGSGPIPTLDILLPVGISFYTFQTLSYSIDIYKGNLKPEKNFWRFALYVSFFPQLVAGPIERAKNLIPQFYLKHKFDFEGIKYGIVLMMWGFFKKMVIADRVSEYVNKVYAAPDLFESLQVWSAHIFFFFQLYCDFSGYSDIAIGIALVLGYKLMINFRQPFFAQDIQELWSRWHISLFTWIRDYIYSSLGGKKKGLYRWYFNVWFIFFVIGIWHGASWNFVIFGAVHGVLVVSTIILRPYFKAFKEYIGLLKYPNFNVALNITFNFFILSSTAIFFRGQSLEDIITLTKKTFYFSEFTMNASLNLFEFRSDLIISIISICILLIVDFYAWKGKLELILGKWPTVLKYLAFLMGIITLMMFAKFRAHDFIYFQF